MQTQSAAMPHLSQQEWDLFECVLAQGTAAKLFQPCQVPGCGGFQFKFIPSVGKQGSRAATIHCHSLSQGPPAL